MKDSNNSMRSHRQDPHALFPEFSRISISQEELLHRTPFVGDTSPNHHHHHDTPSQFDADTIPKSSVPIVILSPPDTNQDVFHTPPEDSFLPSSDVDVPHCTVNQAVDIDNESQVFVDLTGVSDTSEFRDFGKVSELGFPENSRCVKEIGLNEIRSDEFRVLERGISELGEAPLKKLKLGFDSFGISNSEKLENVVGCEEVNVDAVKNDDLCRETTPMVEKSFSEKNVEIQTVQMQNAEIGEGSGMREDPVLVLQMLQNVLESGKDKGKEKFSLFDVLKVLSENNKEDEDDDGHTVLEAAKLAGITFPRPSWWPDDYVSKLFNFDDDQVNK